MSILALYYRIGSGMRALPWIVQARAVWIIAGFMSAIAVASFLVGNFLVSSDTFHLHCTGTAARLHTDISSLGY